ncbi:MAG: hypothetical protein ACRCX2_36395 [Paraclostridium sp.]
MLEVKRNEQGKIVVLRDGVQVPVSCRINSLTGNFVRTTVGDGEIKEIGNKVFLIHIDGNFIEIG